MVFKCQEDSFLREYVSTVVDCKPSQFETLVDGKKTQINGYEVICKNTILFPEGGGQPFDTGYFNNSKIFQVIRKGPHAVHYTDHQFEPGERVKQTVNWNRRFDHMQQHSGQHLISGTLERDFGIKTLSWWLGEENCYIELDAPSLAQNVINAVEATVNELIREGTQVKIDLYNQDTPEEVLKDTRSAKGLPVDHCGDIRVVTIEGVESNMCCGTHVKNLSQLQMIKLLNSEKSKRKNQCLLYFLCGNRVMKRLSECLTSEQNLTNLLNNGREKHIELVEKLVKTNKVNVKNLNSVLKELASNEVKLLKQWSPRPRYWIYHRREGEVDFMNAIVREVGDTKTFLFLSVGEDKGQGNILLYGKEDYIEALGQKICDMLNGKGAGKGTRFQAKVSNLGNRGKVEKMLAEYFAQL